MKTVLAIGGSESSGAAGIAVDLRTFSALGVHGAVAITAVSAQPDQGLMAVNPPLLAAQIRTAGVVDVAKIGLVLDAAQAEVIVETLSEAATPIIVDPVGKPSRGDAFTEDAAWREAMEPLIRRADLVTPNLMELRALLGEEIADRDVSLANAAERLLSRGARAVLIKGGHRQPDPDDLLVTGDGLQIFRGERVAGEFRGTGCMLASAIAAFLARGRELGAAVAEAKEFVQHAMRDAKHPFGEDAHAPHAFFEYYGSEGLP